MILPFSLSKPQRLSVFFIKILFVVYVLPFFNTPTIRETAVIVSFLPTNLPITAVSAKLKRNPQNSDRLRLTTRPPR